MGKYLNNVVKMKGYYTVKILGLVLFSFLLVRCIEPPSFNIIPEITDITFSADTVSCNTDFFMYISFQDGDGNIGLPADSAVNNLFVTESRTNFTDPFTIPEVQENGKITDISGTINVSLSELCINILDLTQRPGCTLDGIDINSISYKVKMEDNEGNVSNEFTSKEVVIKCE